MTAKEADILSVLVQTGILGLRGFWKISAVSKKLLSLRDDATALGFGSVCSGFSSVTERQEVWRLIDDCLSRDDEKALQQLFALAGVSGRYPFLLRRLVEKGPDSEKCRKYLMKRGVTPCLTEISYAQRTLGGTKLTKKLVDEMVSHRILQTDAWSVFPSREDDFVVFDPVSVHFLENDRFDLAESLLDAGSRMDVCAWEWERFPRVPDVGVTPLQCLVQRLVRLDSKEHALRQKGLALLDRVARASKAAGCLDWKFVHDDRRVAVMREGTALGFACLRRDAQIVRVLGGVTERIDQEGLPFLILTGDDDHYDPERLSPEKVDSRCADTLEELANIRGVNLNAVNRDGHTPLSLACSLALEKSAAVLLKRGALPKRVKGRKRMSLSPLYEALKTRSETICSLLLQWKADPNEVVVEGAGACTLLQKTLLKAFTCRESDRKITAALAKLLIENGARACVLSSPLLPTTEKGQTGTPPLIEFSTLLMACQTEDADFVRLLVTKGGGDPNAKAKTREMDAAECPVFFVLWYFRHSDSVIMSLLNTLAEFGADLKVDRGDGHSLLSLACHHQCGSAVLEFLLEKGVQVGGLRREGGAGPVPLVEAAASLCPENVRVLLKWGTEVNHPGLVEDWEVQRPPGTVRTLRRVRRRTVMFPLQAAVQVQKQDRMQEMFAIVKMLIDNGAKCRACPSPSIDASEPPLSVLPPLESSVSPLWKACELRDACLIRLLCEKGGGLPEGGKEVGAAVSVLVSDRDFQSQKDVHCQEGAILEHWRLAESLLQQHGEVDLSLPASDIPGMVPGCGSGSWFFDLISLEEARGPSLLKVIRSSPLKELDRIVQVATEGWNSETHVSSLGMAIRSKWEEGVTALLERGVNPNLDPFVLSESPLFAAFDSEQWDNARSLLKKGAGLFSRCESEAKELEAKRCQLPPDLRSFRLTSCATTDGVLKITFDKDVV